MVAFRMKDFFLKNISIASYSCNLITVIIVSIMWIGKLHFNDNQQNIDIAELKSDQKANIVELEADVDNITNRLNIISEKQAIISGMVAEISEHYMLAPGDKHAIICSNQ